MFPGALELAAVLACGPSASVSHRSAASLWGLAESPAEHVEVTVTGRARVRDGIRAHGVAALHRADRDRVRGIPTTAPARALIDFAAEATDEELERATGEAYARELVTDAKIFAAIERAPRRAGIAAVKAMLGRDGGPQWTHSEGERRMLRLIRAAGLPAPQTQVPIAGWPADFFWRDQRLIVEVDGYPFHSHRRAFERDRKRDQAHIAAGYRVIRFTFRQLKEEPLAVIATIARALGI
jgi:very-short-patch-repair endonuclease